MNEILWKLCSETRSLEINTWPKSRSLNIIHEIFGAHLFFSTTQPSDLVFILSQIEFDASGMDESSMQSYSSNRVNFNTHTHSFGHGCIANTSPIFRPFLARFTRTTTCKNVFFFFIVSNYFSFTSISNFVQFWFLHFLAEVFVFFFNVYCIRPADQSIELRLMQFLSQFIKFSIWWNLLKREIKRNIILTISERQWK